MIYVVLGMHKSGTTLVARLLHDSGINMGTFDRALDYGSGNTYERLDAQSANRAILRGLLIPPLDHTVRRSRRPSRNEAGYLANRDSQAWIRVGALERRVRLPEAERTVKPVIEACEKEHMDWGFKDPRTCLTYPAWQARLPEHRIVAVFRGLGQVLARTRSGPRHPLRALRVVHAWTVHNWMLLRHLQSFDGQRIVLRYEELMAGNHGLHQLSSFVGHTLHDVREDRLYRSRSNPSAPTWVGALTPLLPIDPRELEHQLEELAR
jgi:hypothetical protein